MTTRPYRVMVFPCGSEIGLEAHAALSWSRHIELYGASSNSENHGRFVYRRYLEGLPFVTEPGFVDRFRAMIEAEGIDVVVPAHDDAVLVLARARERLGCRVVASPVETCDICRSKARTYQHLAERGIRVPKIVEPMARTMEFPVFLKPDAGQGSRGVYIARTHEEARFHAEKDPSLLWLEYLPGKEYTVDCFTDRHGNLLFVGARERARVQNGISVRARPVKDARADAIAAEINKAMRLRGAWFFQLKEDRDGEPAVLEVASRIAGSTAVYRSLGVNLALMSVYDALDIDVQVMVNNVGVEMDRALINRYRWDIAYRHVYVELDDTLIIGGRVNTRLAAFLFQCLNNGVKIHLITRRAGDIGEILRRYRIDSLFDEICQLGPEDSKAAAIVERDCVFIDCSFSERFAVHKSLGVPVFDLDAVESLIDWRQ